ncbi:MAG: GCN5-related N-acetyltransferase [Actinomycetota bacterium]|jgi:phosphinothricin acetyltransferase
MSHDIALRPVTTEDAAQLVDIYNHFIATSTVTFDEAAWDIDAMVHKIHAIHDKGLPFLVVEIDGILAGYGYLSSWRDKSAFDRTAENTLYLRPEFQGMGAGGRLLDALLHEGQTAGIREVIAVITDSDDAAGSIALHTARGFESVGTMPNVGYKFERWLGVVMMQKSLRD